MSIYVLDAPMGIGKTSAMINYMREAPTDEHFVFVTPFLSEGERIITECPEKEFVSPETYGYNEFGTPVSTDYKSKMDDFKDKIRDGRNIATTHALFQRFDQEARDLISVGNYTLVMDEVCDLISDYEITPYDAGTLSEKYIDVEDNGRAIWRADETEYKGRFRRYKDDCELGILWYYNRTSYIQMLPKESFEVFKNCYIMTYLFEAQLQRCYFDLQGLEYETIYVEGDTPENYHITGDQREYKLLHIKDKVHIFSNAKMNRIGDGRYELSRGWYEDADNTDNVKQVQDNAYNFFRNKMKAKSTDCLWTCYKEITQLDEEGGKTAIKVAPRGYKKQYIACNARATNAYRDKHYLAYLINLFPNPTIHGFLTRYKVGFNRDEWALSMMVQWIWRSAIRDGEEIWVYVPSRRMRTLLEQWLEEVNA